MNKKLKHYFFCVCVLLLFQSAQSQVRLPRFISDSMILQRDVPVKIWGWASPKEKVSISFNNKKYKTVTGADGKWQVTVAATQAGGPHSMDITGKNKITLNNILIGDVWFCSGQSNMVHQLNIHDVTYANEIATANYPQIRQFLVPNQTSLTGPKDDLPSGNWAPAVGEAVRPFSAVAYFFARQLYEKFHIPIGIINASVGGTPIEAWTSEQGLVNFASMQATIQKNKDTAYVNDINRRAYRPAAPSRDQGMLEPVKWFDVNYMPATAEWRPINIPGYWEDQGVKNLDGVVWYRKEIHIPATMTAKAATVFLGRIIDADELYINGVRVGSTSYQYPQRRYKVPANIPKAGKNTFVVRVTNQAGKGGFVPGKPYCIFSGTDTVDLQGTWQYKVGEVFTPQPPPVGAAISAQHQPTALYNAMIAPFINYSIKGFAWYQGEANTSRAEEYAKLQPAQIADWRNKWQDQKLPFLFVQLPGFMDYNYLPAESQWAQLRQAQLRSLSVPNTGMAVAIDLGEWNDIHPDNKKDVGDRLALIARKLAYGENIVHAGPLFQDATVDGNKIIINFSNTGSGLITKDGKAPGEFAIAGADKKFVWANARIKGNTIMVTSDAVSNPMYVRYAWADNPVNPNVYNREGLPASPFKTD